MMLDSTCAPNMEQKLWSLALILALLKTKWDFFLGGTKGNETLETQGWDSTEIKLSTTSHPSMGTSRHSYSSGTQETHFP